MSKSSYYYSGALICPRNDGFDVVLNKSRWIHRSTERQAKWAATVYKNLVGTTFKES